MNYNTLTGAKSQEGSIKYWVNWDKAPVATIVDEAQAWLYRRLRVLPMRTFASGNIAAGADAILLPERFSGLISLKRTGDGRGKIRLWGTERFESILAFESDNTTLIEGTPTIACLDASQLRLNVRADQAYGYRMWFWQKPEKISPSVQTNLITENYPDLLRATLLAFANEHRKDRDEAARWFDLAMAGINDANVEADLETESTEYEMYWGD